MFKTLKNPNLAPNTFQGEFKCPKFLRLQPWHPTHFKVNSITKNTWDFKLGHPNTFQGAFLLCLFVCICVYLFVIIMEVKVHFEIGLSHFGFYWFTPNLFHFHFGLFLLWTVLILVHPLVYPLSFPLLVRPLSFSPFTCPSILSFWFIPLVLSF
jgi:hypothetical protein